MWKIGILLFILSLLLNFSESINNNSNENKFYSKLIGMVRTDIIYTSLLYLPNRKEINMLLMINEMKKLKYKHSLNDAELAYLIYMWIAQNIKPGGDFYENQDALYAYNTGVATLYGLTSLFTKMCNLLNIEAGSISGYYKYNDKGGNILNDEYSWNYIAIKGRYYLIDILFGMTQHREELCFGTNPEIFIYFHFPKESKWQLLSEPITLERFNSKAYLIEDFYYFGFKTISPDSFEISGSEKIILTYDESYSTDFIVETAIMNKYYDVIDRKQYKCSNGKVEIECNLENEKYGGIEIMIRTKDDHYSIAAYKINHSKNFSFNFKNALKN